LEGTPDTTHVAINKELRAVRIGEMKAPAFAVRGENKRRIEGLQGSGQARQNATGKSPAMRDPVWLGPTLESQVGITRTIGKSRERSG